MNTQRILSVLLFLAVARAGAQFAAEDEIRLRRDTPLHFKGEVFREGRQGELLRVLRYDAAAGKIYILARDGDGKEFALSLADSAAEVLPREPLFFLERGAIALRQRDVEGARAAFVKAAAAAPGEKMAVDLATETERVRQALAALTQARSAKAMAQPELQRRLRNAKAVDRPNAFGGNENKARADAMRDEVAAQQQKLDAAIAAAEAGFADALTTLAALAMPMIENGYLSAGLNVRDGAESLRQQSTGDLPGRAEITQRIERAFAAISKARTELAARKLTAAKATVTAGLEAEPGRAELRQLQRRIEGELATVADLLSLATLAQQAGDSATALQRIESAERLCSDCVPLNELAAAVRKAAPGK